MKNYTCLKQHVSWVDLLGVFFSDLGIFRTFPSFFDLQQSEKEPISGYPCFKSGLPNHPKGPTPTLKGTDKGAQAMVM